MIEIILLILNTILGTLLIMIWIPIITKDKYNPLKRILLGKHEFSGANIMVKPNGLEIKAGEPYIYLGEIRNMEGHCIVVDKFGKTIWGYHIENFRKAKVDEI